jgi:hypothetical protein
MPEQGSGDSGQQPARTTPAEPVKPSKIEIIPLEPKKIIKRSDPSLPVEKRDGSGSER